MRNENEGLIEVVESDVQSVGRSVSQLTMAQLSRQACKRRQVYPWETMTWSSVFREIWCQTRGWCAVTEVVVVCVAVSGLASLEVLRHGGEKDEGVQTCSCCLLETEWMQLKHVDGCAEWKKAAKW